MTRDQYYLLKLAEECSEVSQRALKQIQFGRDEVQKGQDKTNAERLVSEIMDLITVIDILEKEKIIGFMEWDDTAEHMSKKKDKMEKFMTYSRELGRVE